MSSYLARISLSMLACMAFATVLQLAGCAHYRAVPFLDKGTASTIIEHRHRDGLHVAIRDLTEHRTSMKHFARDLPRHGYAPVLVLLELDPATNAAFNLRREELHLVLRNGARLKSVDPQDVIEAVGFSHGRSAAGYLLLIPGPFVAASVNGANAALERDYTEKAFRSIRLSPSLRTYSGVVFFDIPRELRRQFSTEDAFVEVVVHAEGGIEGSGLGKRLEFPVHFTGN